VRKTKKKTKVSRDRPVGRPPLVGGIVYAVNSGLRLAVIIVVDSFEKLFVGRTMFSKSYHTVFRDAKTP